MLLNMLTYREKTDFIGFVGIQSWDSVLEKKKIQVQNLEQDLDRPLTNEIPQI